VTLCVPCIRAITSLDINLPELTMTAARISRSAIAFVALAGLILRSLVAPGLMVTSGSDFGDFSLVICPAQNRVINFEVLADHGVVHRHYGHGTHPDKLESSISETAANVHAESLDPACLVWLGSGADRLRVAAIFHPASTALVDASISRTRHLVTVQMFNFPDPRGPPRCANSLFS